MKINLKELKADGESYNCTRKTAEFNDALADLIQTHEYQIDFSIRPINTRDYEFTGSLKTATREDCSKCGLDFDYPVEERFHEILIPPQPMDRHGKYSKVNHISEGSQEGPSSHEYSADQTFDAGEYVHELIGLSVPLNPAPKPLESGACSVCGNDKFCQSFKYDENPEDFKPQSPFAALKNVKL